MRLIEPAGQRISQLLYGWCSADGGAAALKIDQYRGSGRNCSSHCLQFTIA